MMVAILALADGLVSCGKSFSGLRRSNQKKKKETKSKSNKNTNTAMMTMTTLTTMAKQLNFSFSTLLPHNNKTRKNHLLF